MPYKCKGKCEGENPMDYHTRYAEKWCTTCRVSFEQMPQLRCYCCKSKFSTKKQSSNARRRRTLIVARY